MGRHTIYVDLIKHYICDITVIDIIVTDLKYMIVGMINDHRIDIL